MSSAKHKVGSPVLPEAMMPQTGIHEAAGQDGASYLLKNEAMFTGLRHSAGEHSAFFIALRDECAIYGNRCSSCDEIIVPPFQQRCPRCNFSRMRPEALRDMGSMAASPVIVFFAPSRFKDQVPFAIGYVFLEAYDYARTDTAMLVRCKTTQGMIRPGIFQKNTPVKVVFCDERQGEMLDIFVVPQEELTREQIAKRPLFESDLSWDQPQEPAVEESEEAKKAFRKVREGAVRLRARVTHSPRAQADLANWRRLVKVKTSGGTFGLGLMDGSLDVLIGDFVGEDLLCVVDDPAALLPWLERGAALTNLVMEGTLWVSKPELETITRLDRLPRSLRRDGV